MEGCRAKVALVVVEVCSVVDAEPVAGRSVSVVRGPAISVNWKP